MGLLNVTDLDGNTHQIAIETGQPVMHVLRDAGFNIEAICGGTGSCATCHVHVPSDWYGKLPNPSQDELDFIECAMSYEPEMSRLSCQIIFDDALNGLEILLADDE